MILDLPMPAHDLFTSLDTKFNTLHRELRFIARTLARLQHRHDFALVFSAGKSQYSESFLADFHSRLTEECDIMLRRLFSAPKKECLNDIESAPSSPIAELPPSPSPPACRPRHFRALTEPTLSSVPVTPTKTRPARSPTYSCGTLPKTVTVIVDERSQAVFEIPETHLVHLLNTTSPETVSIASRDTTQPAKPIRALYLRTTNLAAFTDFLHWTKTGHILPHATPTDTPWLVEHHARRYLDALHLGITLHSIPYQSLAITSLLDLGPYIPYPEDLVNPIFSSTAHFHSRDHPARQVIVAIIAAKTCGAGKRRVRHGPRDRNVERGDRIESGTFWKMYDAFVEERGPECGWPGCVEEVVR
ncbi:hypothetical protein KC332_g13354 [Hortaea werneckii]|uniref:Uncharacterized protein n=1 Tax=Hortaea werneckii TaxID=91943 RepID=A0A3M7HG02_HORWE|nr:hypothetical protein KC350_g16230 [Hortaea werneckii]KAI6824357.1 hypothetical protein KC358_g8277 [Hortaea werneckii]KAI6910196.1 hypothetical protein KC348_g13293 [Hortaea werneckii]KAI6936494.1 hypothetical protein KC341_g6187 [Hortaea werneckii]KAI6968329.1 hypothetical protein KC321_g8527 [Hortaea werneckii]